MTMNLQQVLITVALVIAATMLTRYLPFLLFPEGRKTPAFVDYLGRVLPPAVLGMLVIYCYKTLDFTASDHGIPALLAGAGVIALQLWRKNMVLSIIGGTVLYMALIRLPVF